MCGLAGILVSHEALLRPENRSAFDESAAKLKHRGDTETRTLSGPAQGHRYWLTHHRLAFQDISLGSQPMTDHTGEWLIVFNGEIYNHLELRESLAPLREHPFRTRSDTETLLEGYLALGSRFFDLLDGEYACVILRRDGRELVAHRDPSGVKPMFLSLEGVNTDTFALAQSHYDFVTPAVGFASEIKGLMHPKTWHTDGLVRQFVGLYEPIRTPFQNIIALPPGSVLTLTHQGNSTSPLFQARLTLPVGGLRQLPKPRETQDLRTPLDTAGFLKAFQESVNDRLLSDVELGVYLSGGIDSRAVAAVLANSPTAASASRFGRHAFTVGFEAQGYDETKDALDFAKTCGFTSHILTLSDEALTYAYPFAVQTSENIQPYTNGAAKWWLSRFARTRVHGVLTGDGSDELLCGYPSYRYVKWWMHIMRARRNDLKELRNTPLGTLPRDHLYANAFSSHARNPWVAGSSATGHGLDFVESLMAWGVAHPLFGQISALTGLLLGPQATGWLEAQGPSIRSWFLAGHADSGLAPDPSDPRLALNLWQNYFFRTHLPVQVLNWVGDRMEMANTLEGRTPFLSHKMRAFVHCLPDHALVHGFADKFILRQSLRSLMPANFTLQPKKQFGAPFLNAQTPPRADTLAEVFQNTGLDGAAIAARVLSEHQRLSQRLSSAMGTDALDPKGPEDAQVTAARYEMTNVQQWIQTSASLGLVQRTLVQAETLTRDLDFESRILGTGKIVPPAKLTDGPE